MIQLSAKASLASLFFFTLLLIERSAGTAIATELPAVPKTVARLKSGMPVRIVCFGDSVTGVYYHTGSRRAYTDMVEIALRKKYPQADVKAINAGLSGHTTVNALARIDKDVLDVEPTLVTVMFGLNDMTRVPLEQYQANLEKIVANCRAVGAEVLLCTPNNVITTPGRPTEKLIEYCDVVRAVGRDLNVPVVDCYDQLDTFRRNNALAWRLLMSDSIHPNMDGHKRMAEMLVESMTGQRVSLADVPPPAPVLVRTMAKVKQKQALNVLAMSPIDGWIGPALAQLGDDVQFNVTSWDVRGKTLAELERDAETRVRAMKPDLVLIAVPREANAASTEAFIKSYAWTMNWSLNFGAGGWDCLVVHPAVAEPKGTDTSRDELVRQLVQAQDLHLVDRAAGDSRTAERLLKDWIKGRR